MRAQDVIARVAQTGAEWIGPDLLRVPLRTPTLPPATTTNHYFVGGASAVLVDPSTPVRGLQQKVACVVDDLTTMGWRFQALFLTHHHHDHCGAAGDFSSLLGLPIWGHRLTATRLPHLHFERLVDDGDVVAHSSEGPWRALFTPGHAPGHLVLHRDGAGMIAGDMVAGEGTILIDPADGSMSQYLDSLDLMRNRRPTFLAPAHGPVARHPDSLLQHYREHRLQREAKVSAALDANPRRDDELLPLVYGDVPRTTWPIALRSLRAHLIHLQEQGIAHCAKGRWTRA